MQQAIFDYHPFLSAVEQEEIIFTLQMLDHNIPAEMESGKLRLEYFKVVHEFFTSMATYFLDKKKPK